MTAELPTYPEMKDSRVPWLGEVPAHWEVERLRTAVDMRVSNVDKHTKDGEEAVRLCNYTDVYKHDTISASMPFMKATATRDEIDRFRVEPGDVLITKDSETWNDIGVPAYVVDSAPDLTCGYHLALLRPRRSDLSGGYLHRAIQSAPVAYQFHVEANGVTRYGLTHQAIKSIQLPLPPPEEQGGIVRFLGVVEGKIRRYIRARERLVKLLDEQKQAIIHQAVTGQIDVRTNQPYPTYKPTNIPYLPQIPKHWEMLSLRHLLSYGPKNGVSPPSTESGDVLSFSISAIRDGEVRIAGNEKLISLAPKQVESFQLESGDILLVRGNGNIALVAKCGIVTECPDRCVYPDILMKLRPNERVEGEFLVATVNSRYVEAQVSALAKTANGTYKVSGASVRRLLLATPPFDEQTAIVRALRSTNAEFDYRAQALATQIALLREYRTRLIADVVTGKLDVRAAAANLPDLPTAPDDLDDLPEPEEIEEVEQSAEEEA